MATKLNLIIDQGTTFTKTFTANDSSGSPINFTGYSGLSQIRKAYTSSNSIPFAVNLNSNGIVTLTLSASNSAMLTSGRYVYDVRVIANTTNSYTRIVEGLVTITPQVTR